MNATATHHPAPLAPAAERSEPAPKPTLSPVVLAVWEAEDGRCEGCGRLTDRTLARTRGLPRLRTPGTAPLDREAAS